MVDDELCERVRHEWEQFLRKMPGCGGARDVILASWGRSQAAGVNPDPDPLRLRRISDNDLRRRLEAGRGLLEVAVPHLAWASACLGRVPHVVYLTDPDGIVLHAAGDHPEREALGLVPGYDWSEAVMGTNGAGTALAAGLPVAVIGPEHFSRPFQDCTCTGAPIRDPGGEVVGAVDVSTSVADGGPERLAAVAHLAYAIGRELALFGANPPRALLPICSYCKKVRDEGDNWRPVEEYLAAQVGVQCSHGICSVCWHDAVVPHLREAGLRAPPEAPGG